MKAIVHIGLKPGVLDPQGRTIATSLVDLGFSDVISARQGKVIELDVNGEDEAAVRKSVEQMCEKLLANTVIESYTITIEA